MRGIIALQQAPARRRRRLANWMILATAGALAGPWCWSQRAQLSPAWRAAKAWLGAQRLDPPAPQPKPAVAPAALAPAAAAGAAGEIAPPAGASTAAVASAPPARPDFWVLRGLVYDLYSLKPVADAQLTFTSRSDGARHLARVNARGRYSLRLPRARSGGYDVTVRHRHYRSDYLDENEPPFRQMDLAGRQEAGALLLQSQVLHVPVLPPENEEPAEYDMVLVPR